MTQYDQSSFDSWKVVTSWIVSEIYDGTSPRSTSGVIRQTTQGVRMKCPVQYLVPFMTRLRCVSRTTVPQGCRSGSKVSHSKSQRTRDPDLHLHLPTDLCLWDWNVMWDVTKTIQVSGGTCSLHPLTPTCLPTPVFGTPHTRCPLVCVSKLPYRVEGTEGWVVSTRIQLSLLFCTSGG